MFFGPMKIISYNVRGLGGFEKRSEVKRLVADKKSFVLCLQESKLNVVDDLLIKAIWGSTSLGFFFQPSMGASGGLLTVWDCNVVEVYSTTSFPHVLVIRGRVLQTGQELVIANIYAPCDTAAKQVLWNYLQLLFQIMAKPIHVCAMTSILFASAKKGDGGALFYANMTLTYLINLLMKVL